MTRVAWLTFAGIFLVSAAAAALFSPPSNAAFSDSAAVLTFIAATAVAIERVIEMLWTFVGQRESLGQWWPLKQVLDRAEIIEKNTNTLVTTTLAEVTTTLGQVKDRLTQANQSTEAVDKQISTLGTAGSSLVERLNAAKTLAPGSARIAFTSAIASDATRVLSRAVAAGEAVATEVSAGIEKAATAVTLATNIIASFQDNPARRMASLALGTSAGLLISGFVGLNMFAAILGTGGLLAGTAGVLLTGVVIGLGSSPTHEIIKALQNYKRNAPAAQLTTVPGTASAAGTTVEDLTLADFTLFGSSSLARRSTKANPMPMATQIVALRSTE